ncbi:MAG: efflux RND transporter periplasmic adaptor subunit [Lachnospiraceae bacterium]|jgi:RND family efflux transporter MFP subunit|nr:efflux RND transporter periplasmic adaptor subunit [Lachnospiraceae bacterium]
MKTGAKILTGVVIAGVLAAVIVPRLMKEEPPIEAAPLPNVTVENPLKRDIVLESGLIGTIEPSDILYVTPKVAGEIQQVLVSAGDVVKQGQALCKIDNKKQIDNAKIQMDSAAVALQNAQSNLNRMQVLFASGDISAQSFEQVQVQARSAQLQYQAAKLGYDTQVEYSTVTAPIGGKLESVNMELHSMVSQSSQLCVITGEGVKKVSFSVPERIKVNLELGSRIRLQKQGTEYEAEITKMADMISPQTGLFEVEASIEEGDGLAPGSTVRLFVVSDYTRDAITIPVDAVYYDGGDAYAYTCEGSTVHKVPVETGIFDEERIEILSGITMQDKVIVTWSSELYEGSQVNAMTGENKTPLPTQTSEPDEENPTENEENAGTETSAQTE